MAKITKNPMPKDDDFIHQYGGGISQHGTKGSPSLSQQNAEEFQKHMAAQQIQNTAPPKVSPHELVSQMNNVQNSNPVQPMQKPAPENFGPPKINSTDADNQANFGAPGSQGFKNVQSQFGPPKGVQEAQNQTQSQLQQAQNQTEALTSKAPSQPPSTLGASSDHGGSSGGGTGGSGEKGKKKATYKSVQKMEVDNMLQNAMSHMKLKDPDPQAWN